MLGGFVMLLRGISEAGKRFVRSAPIPRPLKWIIRKPASKSEETAKQDRNTLPKLLIDGSAP